MGVTRTSRNIMGLRFLRMEVTERLIFSERSERAEREEGERESSRRRAARASWVFWNISGRNW